MGSHTEHNWRELPDRVVAISRPLTDGQRNRVFVTQRTQRCTRCGRNRICLWEYRGALWMDEDGTPVPFNCRGK